MTRANVAAAVVLAGADALDLVCGVSQIERLLRQLVRAGVGRAVVVTSSPEQFAHLAPNGRMRRRLHVEVRGASDGPASVADVKWAGDGAARFLVADAGATYDQRLIAATVDAVGPAVLVDSAPPDDMRDLTADATASPAGLLCGLSLLDAGWIDVREGGLAASLLDGLANASLTATDVAALPRYSLGLRRELRPIWFRSPRGDRIAQAEKLLIDATQKGAQDIPALLHAPIEKWLVARLCRLPVSPNQITLVVNLLAWSAAWLFASGRLWPGVALALAVGVLDGVDGKQARLKVETTPFGRLEHVLDSLFEYGWWIALGLHFHAGAWTGALIAADLADIAAAGSVLWRRRWPLDDWSVGDRTFRLIAGRRNVYVCMLAAGLLLGAPEAAFRTIVGWAAATALIHAGRALWILGSRQEHRATD